MLMVLVAGFLSLTYLRTPHSADAMPLEVDRSIDWDSVGGLKEHITALKEMVMFPLLYPEYFTRFSVTPPRSVCPSMTACL